ncbi:MAG TPA: hypothetical protein VK638_56715 [Edaphobacter sp.]|nr:hypothetical protein [Edaphobacter sp.]
MTIDHYDAEPKGAGVTLSSCRWLTRTALSKLRSENNLGFACSSCWGSPDKDRTFVRSLVNRFIGRIYDPLFVLRTEKYVEPAPDTIARVARIYYLSWDEIAAFDTSR